ncbi:MAG: cytidine deaminase [Pseudomonadota bacterium]
MSAPASPADAAEAALTAAALAARENAYAPYSGFAVGAAVRDEHGRIHAGCNVENAAYPQGQCAEATAIGAMITAGGRRITAAAIAGPDHTVCSPCGGCRQRLAEFAPPDTPVTVCGPGGVLARYTVGGLLPAGFGPAQLD